MFYNGIAKIVCENGWKMLLYHRYNKIGIYMECYRLWNMISINPLNDMKGKYITLQIENESIDIILQWFRSNIRFLFHPKKLSHIITKNDTHWKWETDEAFPNEILFFPKINNVWFIEIRRSPIITNNLLFALFVCVNIWFFNIKEIIY